MTGFLLFWVLEQSRKAIKVMISILMWLLPLSQLLFIIVDKHTLFEESVSFQLELFVLL